MRALLLFLPLLLPAFDTSARRCVIEGTEVNPDNGATTAGRTGILTCTDDEGRKQYEHEYRNGVHIGLERSYAFDGSVVERHINANRNTEGRKREFHPNGKLKSDGEYRDGQAVGPTKSWHANGTLAALRFYEAAGKRATLSIEYDADGRLRDVSCPAQSVVAEDRALCGFDGANVELALHSNQRVVERRTVRDGKVLKRDGLDGNGNVRESVETTALGHVTRRYHDNGQLAYEAVVENDWRVAETEWYMNGAQKSKVTNEPAERNARSVREHYRDTGVLKEREEWRGRNRTRLEKFDDKGQRSEETLYAEEGHAQLQRKFAPDGTITLEEELYPDGSRKVRTGSVQISR